MKKSENKTTEIDPKDAPKSNADGGKPESKLNDKTSSKAKANGEKAKSKAPKTTPKTTKKRRPSGEGMVRKRPDGTWEGRIVVGHKADGRSIFSSVFAKTQKELLNKLHQHIDLYRGVELNENSRMTLGEWLDKWLEEYAKNRVRPSTLKGYTQYANSYIKPILGGKQISAITKSDIQKLYQKLKKEGRIHEHPTHGKTLSDSMIRSIHSMLHLAMKIAVQEHLIPKNPTESVRVAKANHKEKRILTQEELDRFFEEVSQDRFWHDFFYTELTTGLRRGELCGLRWEDFNAEENTLTVNRTLHREQDGTLTAGETKTGKGHRKILLPESTAAVLAERKAIRRSAWIFPNQADPEQPIAPNSAYHQLKKILKKADLPDIRFHDLRHLFSTMALSNGVDAKTLSSILGHTNASFTLDTYTHVTGDMQRQAANIVGDYLEDIFGEDLLYA
ncbi:MAG: site-specific integrase [Faecalibacterium sp.]